MNLKDIIAQQNGFATLILRLDLAFENREEQINWHNVVSMRDTLETWGKKMAPGSHYYPLARPQNLQALINITESCMNNRNNYTPTIRSSFLQIARETTNPETADHHMLNRHIHDLAKEKHPCPDKPQVLNYND